MPVAEITRTETSERARLLRVDDYDIELDLTRGGEVFGSTSVIRFSCSQPGASTYVDLIAPAVREITLNGVAIDPAEAYADGRIALTGLAERNELRVVADCGYTNTGVGMHRAVDSADSKVYLYTQFEPAEARKVFANFEQPDLKAAFTFHNRRRSPRSPRSGTGRAMGTGRARAERPRAGRARAERPRCGTSRRRRGSRRTSPPSWPATTTSSATPTPPPAAR